MPTEYFSKLLCKNINDPKRHVVEQLPELFDLWFLAWFYEAKSSRNKICVTRINLVAKQQKINIYYHIAFVVVISTGSATSSNITQHQTAQKKVERHNDAYLHDIVSRDFPFLYNQKLPNNSLPMTSTTPYLKIESLWGKTFQILINAYDFHLNK